MCSECITTQNNQLLKQQIQIWWLDDQQFYHGVIQGYDAISQRHCVLYDDKQWEYLSLTTEPALFLNNIS